MKAELQLYMQEKINTGNEMKWINKEAESELREEKFPDGAVTQAGNAIAEDCQQKEHEPGAKFCRSDPRRS